uniref:hypothetical protein n=1 Tax=uncultured Draconibacterium sp. TaxID=1573823 RepID=UPI0032167248
MKVGIDILKKDITIIAKVVMGLDKATEDGKIKIAEWVGIALKSVKLAEVVKTIKQAKKEYLDLDGAEKAELSAHVAKELDLRNDEVEGIIEGLVEIAIGLSDTLQVLEDIKAVAETEKTE